MTTLLLSLPLGAHAGGSWFLGGGAVEIAAPVEVPLLRGADDPRPQVMVDVAGRQSPMVLDLAGGHSQIGWREVRAWGLETKIVSHRAGWEVRAVVPELRVNGLVIRDLRVEVGHETPVLGTAVLDALGVAVVPSEGVVRFSEQADLLGAIGDPLSIRLIEAKKQSVGDTKRRGNGESFTALGSIPRGDSDDAGTWLIHTDWRQSTLSPERVSSKAHRFGGVLHRWTRPTLGEVILTEGWMRRDGRTWNPHDEPLGVLGYDLLWSVDLGVHASARSMAIRPTTAVRWTDVDAANLAVVRSRWQSWREENPAGDAADRPALPGFSQQNGTAEGDPLAYAQHRDLADALWAVGEAAASVQATRDSALVAGDRCETYVSLGLRRLRTAGAMQQQDFVAALVRQPLAEAGDRWEAWSAMSPDQRQDSDRPRDEPNAICQGAWGHLLLARVGQGHDAQDVDVLATRHQDLDPNVPLAVGLAQLRAGRADASLAPLRRSLNLGGDTDTFRASMVAAALSGRLVQASQWLLRLDAEDPWPLSTAVLAAELGVSLPEDGPHLRGWSARQLVAATRGQPVDLASLGQTLADGLARTANGPAMLAQRALWLSLTGEVEAAESLRRSSRKYRIHSPDLWTLEVLLGDEQRSQAARMERSMAWPELPIWDAGNLSAGETVSADVEPNNTENK